MSKHKTSTFEPSKIVLVALGLLIISMGLGLLLASFQWIQVPSNAPAWILQILGSVVCVCGLYVMFVNYHIGEPEGWFRRWLYYGTGPVVVTGFTVIVNWIAFFASVGTGEEVLSIGPFDIPAGNLNELSHRVMFGLSALVIDALWLRGLYWQFFEKNKHV